MKKRFLSMLLVLVMVIGMIPFSALSASAAETSIEAFYVQVEKPVPGNHPSTKGSILGSANYTISKVAWYDENDIELSESDTFAEKGIYTVKVSFACNNGYVLPENLANAAKINGMRAGLVTWNNNFQTVTYSFTFFPERTVVTSDLKTMRDALEKDNENTTVIINEDINIDMDITYYQHTHSFVELNLSHGHIQKNLIINGDINITADPSWLMKAFIENYGSGMLTIKGNGSLTVTFDENDPAIAGIDILSRWQYKNILLQLGYKDNRLIVEEDVTLKTTNGRCIIAVASGGYDIRGGTFEGRVDLEHTKKSTISGGVFKENLYYLLSDANAPKMLISGGTFEKGCTNIHHENIAPYCAIYNKDGTEFTFPGATNSFTDYVYVESKLHIDKGFSSLTPTPDMDEADWDELASDLGTMALGSADTNIDFNFSAKTLPADAIEAGYSVKRALKVTRDGITVYDKEYESNEIYPWNLKDNIDEGGNYHIIPTLNYYLDGVKIEEISHLYTVKVTGSTIKTISLAGIGTPVIGSAPSHAEFAFSNTDGVIIKKVQWEYYSSEMGGGFVNMPDGSKFEEGKRYAVLLELETADGYSFAANKEDMTVYINGQKAKLTYNYTNNEFGVELEMTPITDPAFIVTPVGGNVAEGEKFTITWETNFKPAWIQILTFNSANGAPNDAIDVPADATSFELDANEFGYVLTVYYNGNQCVSNKEKFYVNEIKTIINTIELQVAKPVIGEAPTKPTIKSVNGDESLKDLVSFFNDAKVYWVEADSAEDIANGNKHPTVFADGKIYALHVAIQSTKEIAEDCVLNVYGTDGELLWSGNISFSDPSDKTLVYTDAYLGNFKLELGDVNEDGEVTYLDMQRLYQHFSTDNKLTGDALAVADVNKDGSVTYLDMQRLYQHFSSDNKLS